MIAIAYKIVLNQRKRICILAIFVSICTKTKWPQSKKEVLEKDISSFINFLNECPIICSDLSRPLLNQLIDQFFKENNKSSIGRKMLEGILGMHCSCRLPIPLYIEDLVHHLARIIYPGNSFLQCEARNLVPNILDIKARNRFFTPFIRAAASILIYQTNQELQKIKEEFCRETLIVPSIFEDHIPQKSAEKLARSLVVCIQRTQFVDLWASPIPLAYSGRID